MVSFKLQAILHVAKHAKNYSKYHDKAPLKFSFWPADNGMIFLVFTNTILKYSSCDTVAITAH